MSWLQRLRVDKFFLVLIFIVTVASLFPCEGIGKVFFKNLIGVTIGLIFFVHGTKLSRAAVISGMRHWKLHLVVLFSTFALFPLLGLLMHLIVPDVIAPIVYFGLLYLCLLPGTVQSSIAFTSTAYGNVAAAICSASMSGILGVFLSPLLVEALLHAQSRTTDVWPAIILIMLQLILPFLIGQSMRPLIGKWIDRHHRFIRITDRLSILLVVYSAFSTAIEEDLLHKLDGWSLLNILIISLLLMGAVLIINTYVARWLGFSTSDEITIVFCGSKKSLAVGIPMANVLFPSNTVGIMVLPLIIFHQVQLIICALLAQRYLDKVSKRHVLIALKK